MNQVDQGRRRRGTLCFTLPAVLVSALIVRGGVLIALPEGLAKDTDGYRQLAESLLLGVYSRDLVHPTAYRPPLYPLLLAHVARDHQLSAAAIGQLHLALGVASVLLVYLLACWWGIERLAWLAAILVACDPILLSQSTQVMTETLATFCALACLSCLTVAAKRRRPWQYGLSGGAMGFAMLCRPAFSAWLVASAVVVLASRQPWPRRLANCLAFVLVAAIVASPWVFRNYLAFERPILTTTHGGYTLLLGNNPSFYQYLGEGNWGTTWNPHSAAETFALESEIPVPAHNGHWQWSGFSSRYRVWRALGDEPTKDRFAYRAAIENIVNQPVMFAYACLVRIGRLWGLAPHQLNPDESISRRLLRYAVGVWYLGLYVLAAVGICGLGHRVWRTAWVWGVLLCLFFTVVHAFYWSNLRMRAPLMPVIALVAAAGMAWLSAGKDSRKSLFDNGLQI